MKKFFIALIVVVLASCSSGTSIVSSWRDPDTSNANTEYKKIMVVALVKNEATRRITENRITSIGPKFHSSYALMNGTSLDLTKDQKLKILKDENFDAVVTMRLVDTVKETNYVPGTNTSMYYGGYGGMYGGYGAYGGFGGWYGMYSPIYYDPGYYQETSSYLIETNVFSLKSDKLIWTGTTKSTTGSDIGLLVDSVIATVMQEMKKDGFIPKK
ncbi:hypothetical protein [Flavobacterium sp.]|jgi:hypothetical protein|uniref:hypothetical protein n=1 Tax=Flavobacterium sp. TaxID=239 RepID=UPI0037BF00A8